MRKNYPLLLQKTETMADIFEVVKAAVRDQMGRSRGGLMLGLADLGNQPFGFFGGFFQVGSNIIVMNRIPLQRIKETQPDLYKPYAFHVLLHEYLHTLDYLDERVVRKLVLEITKHSLGGDHLATQIALDTVRFFPRLVYPNVGWQPQGLNIELVEGFDRSSVNYIA